MGNKQNKELDILNILNQTTELEVKNNELKILQEKFYSFQKEYNIDLQKFDFSKNNTNFDDQIYNCIKITLKEMEAKTKEVALDLEKLCESTNNLIINYPDIDYPLDHLHLIKTIEVLQKLYPQHKIAYSKLLNAKATNALATIPTSSRAIKAQFTYHPEIDSNSLFTDDDVKVTIKDFNNATQLGNSILFFYYLLCSFTQNISYKNSQFSNTDLEIYFDVEEYLTARKKKITPDNKKNIIREVKKMYETLKRVSLDFEEYSPDKKEIKHYSLEIFAGKGTTESLVKRSKNYFFIINPLLANYLLERNYITYFPNTAFSIDIMRHPNALSLINKLSVLYSQNYWKSNKGLISLTNLLDCVSDIPDFETVSKSNRHYFDRIIEPLENELDYLQTINILSKWEWTNKKREPLSNEQLKSYNYKALSNCYLSYELADYPEQEQQEFKKRKEKKKTITTKKKKIS